MSAALDDIQRLLSGHAEIDTRVAAATALKSEADGDRRIIRALVQGMWDDSEAVRATCRSALEERLDSAGTRERETLVTILFVNLAGDPNPPTEVSAFLNRLVSWVRRHRTEEANLFALVLSEAERARSGGGYSQPVSRALKRLYELPESDETKSRELVDDFHHQQSLESLRSDSAPLEEVKNALNLFGDQSIADASLEVLLYHLLPLRTTREEQTMLKAVRNLRDWSEELPQEDLFELTDAVEQLTDVRRGQRESLPQTQRNEIGISDVAVGALTTELERFRELTQYEQLLTPTLETLDGVYGVRNYLKSVESVALEEEGVARSRAIDLLTTVLTAIETETRHNRRRIKGVHDEEVARIDAEIRDLLQQVATEGEINDTDTRVAVHALLDSRPDDLESRIEALVSGQHVGDTVVGTTLETISSEALLEATDPLEMMLHRVEDDPAAATQVIETLERLGDDTSRRILEETMTSGTEPAADRAREALIKSGYYERVRAMETRERSRTYARDSEVAESERIDAAAARRKKRTEYKEVEDRLRTEIFEADQALRSGFEDVLERRIESLDTLIELYTTDRRVEQLVEQAANYHDELGRYLSQIPLGQDVRDGILEEFETIDQELRYLSKLTEDDGDRVAAIDQKLDELGDAPTITNMDEDAEHRAELHERERQSLKQIRERYRQAASERADRVNTLRTTYERKLEKMETASVTTRGSISNIQAAVEQAESQAATIDSLTDRREREWNRVLSAAESRDEAVDEALKALELTATELEEIQRRIDTLTERISDRRLTQQHTAQQSYEQREIFKEVEPRARGEARHQSELAEDRAAFYTHRRVYADFIRRYYETQLDIVREEELSEAHAEKLDRISSEISEHLD
jgi:hypothetical protein